MSIGYRVFIVHSDDSVEHISQKAFEGFFSRNEPSLKKFAGSNIHIAMALYTLKERKPDQVIRIDNMRLTVNTDGSLDEDRSSDALRLAMNRVYPAEERAESMAPVIDATAKFDERRWEQYNPKLSGPAHKKILERLFGGNV